MRQLQNGDSFHAYLNSVNKKEDSRIKRSKRDLANALEELLEEKNIEDISIQEIANRAMVSKATLYNNFLDKNELLLYVFSRHLGGMIERAEPILESQKNPQEILRECFDIVVDFFLENPEHIKKMIANDKTKAIYWNINSYFEDILLFLFRKYSSILNNDLPPEVAASFYAGGISNILYSSFLKDAKIDRGQAVGYLTKLFAGVIPE